MKDKWAIFNAEAPDSLMEGVLDKTSGGVCGLAEGQLPDFVDGALEDANRDLVSMHLDGCDSCRALERVLTQLNVDLETLRKIEPRPEFASGVIAATSDRFPVVQGLAAIWRRMIERPRFAYEFAYVGTVALVLVFWLVGGDNMRLLATGLSRSVPVASEDLVKNTTVETVKLTGAIKTKVSRSVKTSVASGQALVGENTQTLVDRTALVSEWTKDKWMVFAEKINKRRSNHD